MGRSFDLQAWSFHLSHNFDMHLNSNTVSKRVSSWISHIQIDHPANLICMLVKIDIYIYSGGPPLPSNQAALLLVLI